MIENHHMNLPPDVVSFLAELDPVRRSAAETFVDLVLSSAPRFQLAMKWNRPTFTVDGNWHHWVCAVQPSKGRVSLEFHKGVLLDDPNSILVGDGKYLRRFTVNGKDAINPKLVPIIRDAVAKQTDMLDTPA